MEDPIIITSDPSFAAKAKEKNLSSVFYVVPRKQSGLTPQSLDETQVFMELSDISKEAFEALIPSFKPFTETKKYVNFKDNEIIKGLPEFRLWKRSVDLASGNLPSIEGHIVSGFKRGSKQLGVPTANIEMVHSNLQIIHNLIPGVYSATCEFVDLNKEKYPFLAEKEHSQMPCALSIGWNPTYANKEKTVEVFIIEDFGFKDFYGQQLRIHLKSYLRAEALFSDYDHLILAIQCDIEQSIEEFERAK